MNKAFYKFDGEKCTQFYLDTYDKLADINLTDFIELDVIIDTNSPNPNYPAQPDSLIFKDGVARLKNDDDYRAERIACAEETIEQENTKCMQYQTGVAKPRLDPNFIALVISPYGLQKSMGTKTPLDCPCCEANTQWMNTLWQVVWTDIKVKIRNGDTYSLDFEQLMIDAGSTPNPPHSFDECFAEIQ